MKPLTLSLFLFLALFACKPEGRQSSPPLKVTQTPALQIPEDTRPFAVNEQADGITVDIEDHNLREHAALTITFPTDMVTTDKIDAEDSESPIVTWPDLNAKFVWRTPSQGEWSVDGPRIPGQAYRLRLREGLKDADGKPVPTENWAMQMDAVPLTVNSEYEEREHLSDRPQVPLQFNYLMRLDASGIWFQDRATRQKYPAEILLNSASATPTGDAVDISLPTLPTPEGFRVRPRDPLPVGATYDLIVDTVQDAYAGRGLPYPRVFPLGDTTPAEVDYVAARNWPTDTPHIEIKFHTGMGTDELPPDAVTISPTVPHLALRREGSFIYVDGDFNIAQRYRVTISDKVQDEKGYTLAKPSVWGATFHAKESTILFPEQDVINQRSSLGLRFAFIQVNTGAVTWKLARVPIAKYVEISEARKKSPQPKLLVDEFALETVAQGEFPAAGQDKEDLRTIEWKPQDATQLAGPFIFEVSASGDDHSVVSNATFIFFNEIIFTQKETPTSRILRLAEMGSANPVAGVTVHVVTRDGKDLATGTTDAQGNVDFPATALAGAAYYVADTPGHPAIVPAAIGTRFPSGSLYQPTVPAFLGQIITDRPLYRPGQEVKIKGLLRVKTDGVLKTIPAGTSVAWEIVNSDDNSVLSSGTAKLSASGGWDAAWNVPPQGKLGEYRVRCAIDGIEAGNAGDFQVEEFRNPSFSIVCEPRKDSPAGEASITVSSQYFHGAPNVGSKVVWKATWVSDHDGEYINTGDESGFKEVDLYSKDVKAPNFEATVEGEAVLDANGRAVLTCKAPFRDPGNRALCPVSWEAAVTGPDGQTITGGVNQEIVMNDVTLGVHADPATGTENIAFDLRATPRIEGDAIPQKVNANLFIVRTKTVKERIAPFVYRFRNTDEYESIQKQETAANGRLVFTPKEPGRYVLIVAPLAGQPGMQVSDEIYLADEGEAEVAVQNDTSLTVKPIPDNDKPIPVGTTASFQILSPSAGVAWVTVETNRILESYTLPFNGNSSRIEIPVRADYVPNASVSVYLLRPGQKDGLPGEMFGYARLNTVNLESELKLEVAVDKSQVEPRQPVHGKVTVTANGKPVPNAELAVYVVDDSILELGGWTLPTLMETFFPDNPFAVVTCLALQGYVDGFLQKNLTQKGYVVGEMGKDEFGNVKFTRKDFRPLILWAPSLKTNAQGIASFECTAPDNLTRFRAIAIGQTVENQFGSGDTTFEVTKNLIIEPALPRFLREGDTVELRAVARQKLADNDTLTVRCTAANGLELSVPGEIKVSAAKDQPVVVRFSARAGSNLSDAKVRFDVVSQSDPKRNDSVEMTLPIVSRTILVNESATGKWNGSTFKIQTPATWANATGKYDLTLSTSEYLTKLMGIPMVLDYPHGCFEQKSSRLLVYTALGKLLAYLPKDAKRDENYQHIIRETLEEFDTSILPDGTLPYWPFGTEANIYVTIQSAWAVAQAQQVGFETPEDLSATLPDTLKKMVLRKSRLAVTPTLRAFALFALTQFQEESDEEITAAAEEMFLNRDKMNDEGRAMLAIALHTMEQSPEKQTELLNELPKTFARRDFDALTFSSVTRTEAICDWARILIAPDDDPNALKKNLETLMQSSASLSTQENLWLLIAFNALLEGNPPPKLPASPQPKPDAVSSDRSAAEWSDRDLAKIAEFAVNLGKSASGTYVAAAKRALTTQEQSPVTRGMRIERVLKNLTDSKRTGTADAPFRIGDQILISYRFSAEKPQSFVALTDTIPAGIEVVNPNLEMFGKYYQLPAEPGQVPPLSYCEMRDKETNLYFNQIDKGPQSYSVLARATSAGIFAWPSTQLVPMYDSRFHARTGPLECIVTSE